MQMSKKDEKDVCDTKHLYLKDYEVRRCYVLSIPTYKYRLRLQEEVCENPTESKLFQPSFSSFVLGESLEQR